MVDQMNSLLALWRDRSLAGADVKNIALEHIRVLDEKAKALKAMSDTLRHLANNCHGDRRPDCPIIEGFASAAAPEPKKRQPRFGLTDIAPDRAHAGRRRSSRPSRACWAAVTSGRCGSSHSPVKPSTYSSIAILLSLP